MSFMFLIFYGTFYVFFFLLRLDLFILYFLVWGLFGYRVICISVFINLLDHFLLLVYCVLVSGYIFAPIDGSV